MALKRFTASFLASLLICQLPGAGTSTASIAKEDKLQKETRNWRRRRSRSSTNWSARGCR